MAKIRINVYTNMDNHEEDINLNAIINNKIIKYIDSDNNKFIVDCNKNLLIKENDEFIINIDFGDNMITIFLKDLKKEFKKEIETLALDNDNNIYYVKYKLIDENIINEYRMKFL